MPAAFRLTGSKKHAQPLLSLIQNKFFKEIAETVTKTNESASNETKVKPLKPTCLPW